MIALIVATLLRPAGGSTAGIVVLDVDAWQDRLAGTGFVPRIIPVFYAVDASGKPTGRKITGDDWGKNKDVPERMAPVLEAFFTAR